MQPRWIFAGICLLAAGLRVAHFREIVLHDPFFTLPEVDAQIYDAWARNILAGEPPTRGVLFLGPLYAYFVALVYAVAGAAPAAVKLVQVFLGVASVALVGLLAREVFERRVALVASAIAAVYEMSIFYGGTMMIVNIQVPLVLGLVWAAVRALRDPSAGRWLGCGLLCGLCALARQTELLFAPLLVGWLFVSQRRLSAPRRAALAAWFGGAVAVLLLPFTVHNYRASGDFVLVNSMGGPNLYMGNNPHTDGTWVPPRFGRRIDNPLAMQDAFARVAEAEAGRPLRPSEISAFWMREALDFIVREPAAWLALELRKLLLFVNAREVWNVRAIEVEREFSWVMRLPLLRFGAVAPFALLGLGLAARRWRPLFPLYAMVAVFVATALLFFVVARYRAPVVPILMIFAAFAVVWLVDTARTGGLRRVASAVLALAALGAVVHLPLGGDSLHMAYYNLGNKYLALERWDEAIESFEKSIAIRPGFVSSRNNLALAYEGAGRREEAIEAWRGIFVWSVKNGEQGRAERAYRHLDALGAAPELPTGPQEAPNADD